MSAPRQHELPPELHEAHQQAVRLEWLTLAYLATAVVVVFLTLGSSQAMKAAWIEDLLSLLPPIAFLVAAHFRTRPPTARFPWGYHRSVTVGYLVASVALLILGAYVLLDSAMRLVLAEHPPIGTVVVLGQQLWLGWLMLAALVYTGVPPVLLGRRKLRLAARLHDEVLYADAEMNRADWLTAGAAAIGVLGIGLGLWWADAVAGAVIALDITRDGWRNVRRAVSDVMDSRPDTYDGHDPHPIVERAHRELLALPWVRDARLRLREEGHVFTGEALVVPADDERLVERVEDAARRLRALDWQLHDVVVMPVATLEQAATEDPARALP